MIRVLAEPLLQDLNGVSGEASTVLASSALFKGSEAPFVLRREVRPDPVFRHTLESADEAFR